jgi:O-antigen/teichoic acid export membrane protein
LSFKKDLVIYSIADIVSKSLLIIVSPFLTRLLTTSQYGAFSLYNAIWGAIAVIQLLGLDWAYEVYLTKRNDDNYKNSVQVSTSRVVFIGFSVLWILYSLVIAVIPFFKSFFKLDTEEIIVLNLLLLPNFVIYWVSYLFRFKNESVSFVKISLICRIIPFVLAVPILVFIRQQERLFFFVVIQLLLVLLSILFLYHEVKKKDLKVISKQWYDRALGREMFFFGLRLLPSSIFYSLSFYMDRIIAGIYMPIEKFAVVGLATQLAAIVFMLRSWFGLAWNPYLVNLLNRNGREYYEKKLQFALKWVTIFFLTLTLLIKVWALDVIKILYTKAYYDAHLIIPITSLATTLSVMSLIAHSTRFIKQSTKYINQAFALALALNIAACFLIIPRWGLLGVSVGIFTTEFVICLFYFMLGRIYKNITFHFELPLLIVVLVFFACIFINTDKYLPSHLNKFVFSLLIVIPVLIELIRHRKNILGFS